MLRSLLSAIVVSGLALSMPSSAEAGKRHSGYRNGPQVKGYVQRRGGYSYSYADSINTYGDSRSNYGGASVFRDPNLDRQTIAGPFDHGFFFDSGMGSHGGDSPYMN
jgi:hypothetical protein